MNYSRIVGLISEIATWAPSSLFHLNIWILSTHVKQDYYSTVANMQYLKVLKAVEERKAQTTFSLKVALMLVKVTWRDNAGGRWGWFCTVLNLRKRVYPQVIILMSPHPLFFTLQWLQCCSCFTSSGDKSDWHSTPLGTYIVRYKVLNFSELLVILFLQP